METPSSPHGSAVSGLMQQLKSGEISKMQLFQQIAKLQAATAATANTNTLPLPSQAATSTAMAEMSSVTSSPAPFAMSTMRAVPTATSASMNSSAFSTALSTTLGAHSVAAGAPHAALTLLAQPSLTPIAGVSSLLQQSPPVHFARATSAPPLATSIETPRPSSLAASQRAGAAPIVESDAEFLASGVSHDKAPRFSVQEWMATKNRTASLAAEPSRDGSAGPGGASTVLQQASFFPPSQMQEPLREEAPFPSYSQSVAPGFGIVPVSGAPQLFALPQQQLFQSGACTVTSHVQMRNVHSSTEPSAANHFERDDRYEYNPHRQLYSQSQQQQQHPPHASPDSSEQEFIDFTEHFRDEIDGAGPINRVGGGGSTMNLTGKSNNGGGGNNNTSSGGGGGGGDDAAFHTRVTRWKSQKDAIREQMKQQLLQSELDECTFAPKVNPKSTKVAAKLRTRQGSSKEVVSSPMAVSERLYQEADNYKAREELAQRIKAEEEADLERECTFKPRINRATALTDKVKAKYMNVQKNPSPSLTAAAMESTAKELEQCTFYPKVNPISVEMVSAQLYLQQDIYERLSRPCCMTSESPVKPQRSRRRAGSMTDDDINRETDSDLASSVASPRRRSQDDMYIRSLSPRRRRSLATSVHDSRRGEQQRPRSAGGICTEDEKDERARQLRNFLERQHFHEEARRKKIATTKQQLQPAHKPTINKKSLGMMENGRKGDFLERITKYALRKEHDNVKKKSVRVSDPNCTFKPSINQTSTKRKGRSVTELSRGDLLRRETTQRLMKLKMEQEEMAALTFRPQLNRVSERHEGKLKILTSPDTYLQRIQQQSQAHTIKQRRAVQEKEMEEFAECTFKPRTIEAPAYIQRIARSVSLTKALKQQQLAASRASEKPEWK